MITVDELLDFNAFSGGSVLQVYLFQILFNGIMLKIFMVFKREVKSLFFFPQ